ncbi:MAG: PAS domain-containing protein [Desulfobaccales bacterium]
MVPRLRILIVEDQASDAELMAFELRQANLTFTAQRVDNDLDFIRELEQSPPDLILSDYHLPHFNGGVALALAQERCPDVPFIFVSGAIGEEVAIDNLKRGATDYVLKDRLSRLAPAVKRALREAVEIRERLQAEEALRQSEQNYRLLVGSIPAVVYKGYLDWSVDFFDHKIEALTGHKKEEFDSRRLKWLDLMVREDLPAAQKVIRRARQGGGAYYREFRIRTRDDRILWIQDRGQIIFNAEGGVEIFSGVFFDATEAQRGKMAVLESERRLRYLSSELLKAQEHERKRLSMELHDELGQSLTVMKLRTRAIEKGLRPDEQADLKQECRELLAYLDQVIDNVRRLSRDLSPSILEDLGLLAALKYLVDGIGKYFTVEQSFEIQDLNSLFPPESQIIIYRIFQECLHNITKHAGPCRVSVALRQEDGAVTFTIEDEGAGFDVAQISGRDASRRGLGLAALYERGRILGGSCQVWSRQGAGTKIACRIPIPQKKNEQTAAPGVAG